MLYPALETPAKRVDVSAAPNVDLNLRDLGGMARAASKLTTTTGGRVVLTQEDGAELDLNPTTNNQVVEGHFNRARFGNRATVNSAAGSFPGTLVGGETLVLRFDELSAEDLDTDDVTVTFLATDVTQALAIARINEALEAAVKALRPHKGYIPHVWAADGGGGVTSLTGRAGGTDASVEVVSQSAAIATMLGFSVGSTAGTNFAAPAAPAGMIFEW